MDYYIQGDAARAKEIKAAFEKLGYDVNNWLFTTGVYYTLNGRIVNTKIGSNEHELIFNNPDYKELELPVESKFKVGDWVVRKDGTTFYGGNYVEQVKSVTGDEIGLSSGPLVPNCVIRLWTIQDAEDGDVLAAHEVIVVFKEIDGLNIRCHLSYHYMNTPMLFTNELHNKKAFRPATKDECELLFSKMKEERYEWDDEKKEFCKIQHYDISNFHAGMPVLVRDYNKTQWRYVQFSHYVGGESSRFNACGNCWCQCIPFEGNEHLLGTTDMCDEQYVNW